MLQEHIASGVCTASSSQPARVVMPPRGSVVKSTNGLPTEAPNLTIIIDMESRLIAPEKLPREDYIFETDNINDDTFTLGDGVIHHHVPQSVGMLVLNHENKVIDYRAIVADDVQYTFPDALTSLIEEHSREINRGLCNKAHLTEREEEDFRKARRCLGCSSTFKSGSEKHRHHDHRVHPVKRGGVK